MARTDWQTNDTVLPADMNQIGQEINTNTDDLTAATNAVTGNTLARRDANGRFKAAAPAAVDDVSRKQETDTALATADNAQTAADNAQSNITTHIGATTGVHGATSSIANNTIITRDGSGRAQVSAPAVANDIARKAEVDLKLSKSGDTMTGPLVVLSNASGQNIPDKTTAVLTYYVRTDGSDTNDGLSNTVGGAFKTIQRAINGIPQNVNHLVTINVSAGTYAEDVIITNFTGQISILATNTAQNATNVNSMEFNQVKGRFQASGFTATTTTAVGFTALYCDAVIFSTCWVAGVSAQVGFIYTTSIGRIELGLASNRSFGISATSYSHVAIVQVAGSNNTSAGVNSDYSSYVGIHSLPYPLCTIASSNLVVGSGATIAPVSGVLNPWGDNTWSQRSRLYVFNNATQSISAATSTKVAFQNVSVDNLSEYNNTTFRYTAKGAGAIDIKGMIQFNSGFTASMSFQIHIYKNGISYHVVHWNGGTAFAAPQLPFSDTVDVLVGDYLEIYVNISVATVIGLGTFLNITRIA